jgi:multidomain signaling protein FimX
MHSDSEKLIRLLIVDEGLHQAEQITSSLRSSGLHVLAEHAEDDEDMTEIINSKPLDLILFSMDLPDFSLQQAQHLIHECGRHLSLIGITDKISEPLVVHAMEQGAQDIVLSTELEHLALVVKREAQNLKLWRKFVGNEKELHESEKRCQSLLANSKDAVAYVHEGMHIYANAPYLDLFGHTDFDEVEGVPLIDMVESSQQDTLKQFLRNLSQNKNTTNELNLNLIHHSGEVIQGQLEFSRASFDGEPCTQILIRSKADTSELEEQINYLHKHDLVTGLYNRQYFMDKLQAYIDEAISGGKPSVMLYISIDNFTHVRDTVGISGCDILINDIAKILEQGSGDDERVCRFGAYSYTILCHNKDKQEVEAGTANLLKMIEQNISDIGKQSISATCSISIYYIDENVPPNPNEIIARAERNLDQIQRNGGNRAEAYVPVAGEMSQEEEDAAISRKIKAAISNNSISPRFQPVVSIGGASGERYEITRQLKTEEDEILSDAELMPSAERSGSAKTLDRWSIMQAIRIIGKSIQANRKVDIFVTLSADSIQDPTLARWIAQRLQGSKIPGERLVIGLNEAHAVSQLKAAKTLFKGLKQLHCQVFLDGFGTGLNPFQLVKHLPADYLRINAAYMDGLSSNQENQVSIREITEQASSMEIRCIVPNVADASVLSVLWSVGADFVQGDFLQAPSDRMNYDFTSMSS